MATSNQMNDKASKTDAKAKAMYIAATPILHDGEPYAVGDEIELDAKQAKALGDNVAPAKAK